MAHGEEERRTIPKDSSSLNVFSATANWAVDKQRARAKTGGPEVWMEWTVLCFGDGQEVEGGVVTEGNLLRMERISGA